MYFPIFLCATAINHSFGPRQVLYSLSGAELWVGMGRDIHKRYFSAHTSFHHLMTSTLSLSAPSGAVRFTSWNVKGLNSPVKRNKVINQLKFLNTKIAFLQETHLKPLDHAKLHRGWVGQLYHSSFSSKACGAAILIHKSIPFSLGAFTWTVYSPFHSE